MNTDRLTALAISGTGFVFDPVTGDSFSANATGIEIINALKTGKAVSDIRERLLARYDVPANELEADIEDFIGNLRSHFLVT